MRKTLNLCLLIALLLGMLPTSQAVAAPVRESTGPTTPQEMESFFDTLLAGRLESEHIPGVVVLVVKDGAIFFSKGYGYANIGQKIPVLPGKTVFRIGSVNKTFTATAVMQLVERGQIRLDDDINLYLKTFKVPGAVTFANLLTHTAGYDETILGIDPSATLEQYVRERQPAIICQPGQVMQYSNYGYALAGYLVEVVSGVPYADYIEQNIFQPLNMKASSFAATPDLAQGYIYQDGGYVPQPYEIIIDQPAGALNTTATDMAHYMLAHLQDGRLGEAQILSAATAQTMHRQAFVNDPRLPGMTPGFYELAQNGLHGLEHAGGLVSGYVSQMTLLPEQQIGIFIAANTLTTLPQTLNSAFIDHYYPHQAAATPQPPADFKNRAAQFVGVYRVNQVPRHNFEKLIPLFDASEIRVSDGGDGTLIFDDPMTFESGPSVTRLVEVEPLVFERADDHSRVVFRQNAAGETVGLFTRSPFVAFDKIAWYETASFNTALGLGCLLVFLLSCLVWVVGWLWARLRKLPTRPTSERLMRRVAGMLCLLNLVAIIGFMVSAPEFLSGKFVILAIWLSLALVAAGLTPVVVICTVLMWKNRSGSFLGRLHYTLVALAAIAFIWFLNQWNLLGFKF
jgi:CubicO group peptidase (beta-lactamase class C family)